MMRTLDGSIDPQSALEENQTVVVPTAGQAQSSGNEGDAAAVEKQCGSAGGETQPVDQVTTFMDRVVAWPGATGAGWVNLHWKPTKMLHPNDFRGKPFKEVGDFVHFAHDAASKPGIYREIYFCLSTQAATGKLIRGSPIAARSQQGALLFKAIWIDVDVKPTG